MSLNKKNFEYKHLESPAVYVITAEMVQDMAESNLGRRLKEKEIERLYYAMLECEEAYGHLVGFMLTSAEYAMDEESNDWSVVDREYLNRKHQYFIGEYSIGSDKKEKSAIEVFQEGMASMLGSYYTKTLSENIKRGLKKKKEREGNPDAGFEM